MDTIGALTLLSMGDFFVEMKKTSEKATKGLYRTLSLSGKAIENLTKGDMMWPGGEVKLSSDQALDSVDVAEACGGRAVQDGTFHPSDHSDFSCKIHGSPRVVFCKNGRVA